MYLWNRENKQNMFYSRNSVVQSNDLNVNTVSCSDVGDGDGTMVRGGEAPV